MSPAHGEQTMLALFLLVGISAGVPLLAARLRLPTAVVLILAGMAFGPTGLGWIHETPVVEFLAELGFLILMFIAGMEIDFTALRFAGLRSLWRPTAIVLGFFAIAAVAALLQGISLFYVLVIAATSVGMPLAVLQETGQTRTDFGREVLLTASIGEFVSILAIVGYELSTRYGASLTLVSELAKVAGLFLGSALAIRFARAVVWWYPERFRRMVEHEDTAELGVRAGLMLMFGFVVVAGLAGVEPILGAFIAGALVAFVLREKHALEAKLSALGQGLFIPLFLIVVGVRFDPGHLDGPAIVSALTLIGLAGVAKLLPLVVLSPPGLSLGKRLAAGSLIAAPLTLVVAIGAIGRRLGVIDARAASSVVLVALGLSVIFPVIFQLLAAPVGLGGATRRLPGDPVGAPRMRARPGPAPR